MIPGYHSEDVVRDWLEAIRPGVEPSESLVAELTESWAPNTLKQVFTTVMSLGKAAGRLGETMALLGHQEAAFRRLREEIGIPRAAPPDALPRVAVVLQEGQDWWTPGEWVPDIIDRAAGHDVLRAGGDPIAKLRPDQLEEAALDHVFVLTASGKPEGLADAFAITGADVHVIDRPERWLIPGPGLPHAVFEAASYVHGVSSIFSGPDEFQSH